MKPFILVLLVLFSRPPEISESACKQPLPHGVLVREMRDNTWIVFEGEEYSDHMEISYYFVAGESETGWLWCDCGTKHYPDSCSAKTAFKKFMDHNHFK